MTTLQEDLQEAQALLDELARSTDRLRTENEVLTKLLTADPAMLGAVRLIKQQTGEIEALRERNAGLMEEKNAAIAEAKKLRRKLEKA